MTRDELEAQIKQGAARWTELHKKHFAGLTDMTLIVLNEHLLVEQLLTALLSHHCHTPAELGKARTRNPCCPETLKRRCRVAGLHPSPCIQMH
jgi:hypothetical protein